MTRRDALVWLPVLLLMLALALLFWPLAFGETLFWGLPALQFYPWRQLAFEQMASGHLPIWNPYSGGGAPLLANYQTAVFYPPNWLYLLLPGTTAMSVIALGHVVWAGLGMWLFAGRLGVSLFGRGISLLAYALGGYLIARLGSFPTANAGAWMPWVFVAVHETIAGRRWIGAGGLALALGMQLLSGHAQTTWYSSLAAGVYGLWLALWAQRAVPWRARLSALGAVSLGVLLGVALAAVQLIPTVEYLRESQRADGLDYETVANLSYSPFRLITLFTPNFYGTPADGSYFTKGIFFEDAAYIGFIPITAVFAALVARWRRRHNLADQPALRSVPLWGGLALVALLVAMGKHGPVFRLLYDMVPTFAAFREPVRWLIVTEFSLAVLAGIGVDAWGRGPRVVFWSRLAAAGGAGMTIMVLGYVLIAQPEQRELDALARGLIALGVWGVVAALLTLVQPDPERTGAWPWWRAAVMIVVALDLTWAAFGLNPTVPDDFFDPVAQDRPAGRLYWFDAAEQDAKFEQHFVLADYRIATEHWQAARMSLLPNLNVLDRLACFTNDDPFQPRYHQQYVDVIEELGPQAGPLLRAAGVTRVIGLRPEGWTGTDGTYNAPDASPNNLAWLAGEAAWFEDDEALIQAMRDLTWSPERVVLLSGTPGNLPASDFAVGEVHLVRDDPTERHYRVVTDGPAYLVISTSWYPGWKASVNGRETRLVRANLAFMALAVPEGESEVVLTLGLIGWPWSAVISGGAALTAVGLIGLGWRRKDRVS